ncbi:MAG TPA: aromatic ring-hydroxylating dioxygenase subunit alpha [Stellaceae bacterium]|nr:aromatic ring-hydroxylating dioxygenase subunit alpha [Stellaceae bacterium]
MSPLPQKRPVAADPFSPDSEELRPTRAALERAQHLPAHYYTAPEILEREKELLFFKDWLAVARVEEFANPGDYRAMEIVGEPIVVCRDQKGNLNAFANVCRHRGVAVAMGAGNATQFSCPYHAWSYGLDGRLTAPSRPRGLGSFDYRDCRLPPLRVDTWGGFVFVSFDPGGPSLSSYLAADGYQDAVAYVHPEKMTLVDTYSYEIDCNWKLVPENLADVYHVEVIHRGTFGAATYSTKRAIAQLTLTKYGWHKEYVSGTMAPDAELLFGPAPWLAQHEKGSLFAFSAFLRPNFYLFARADMVQPWVAYPLSATRTRVTGWTCIPAEFADRPAFKEKVAILAEFARRFAGEDADLMRAIQKGLTSRYFVRGPMHELEVMIHHRINRYLEAMAGEGEAR